MVLNPEWLHICSLNVFDETTGEIDYVIGLNEDQPWKSWEPFEDIRGDHTLYVPVIEWFDVGWDSNYHSDSAAIELFAAKKSERIMPAIADHEVLYLSQLNANEVHLNQAKINNRTNPTYLQGLEFCLQQPTMGIMDHWAKQLLTEGQSKQAQIAQLIKAYQLSDSL